MTSLEERMARPEEQTTLITLLNNIDLYTKIVCECRYQRIGIQVLNNGQETFAYTSFNDAEGRITKVEKGLQQPDITASVEERVLTEILDRADEIQEHLVAAALQYAGQFSIRPYSAYLKIVRALIMG
ncbi:hypothetical protein HYT55_00020 [Candidatus Woesearchaeota archaeon]|nr:hypothetical protein [Candidatus Woesearchaeota archaeon]